jgi:hypothetical protein
MSVSRPIFAMHATAPDLSRQSSASNYLVAPAGMDQIPDQNPISVLAKKLQNLPPLRRWYQAQQDVIGPAALGLPPRWGRRRSLAYGALKVASGVKLAVAVATATSLLFVLRIYLDQFRTPNGNNCPPHLFIGNGAANDAALMKLFEGEHTGPALYLNEERPTEFAAILRVKFFALLRAWLAMWREARADLFDRDRKEGLDALSCLTELALAGHRFAYARAWFGNYLDKLEQPTVIAFSVTSNTIAHAAIVAGATAWYFPHGFQRFSLVLPGFSRVFCNNRFEAEFFRERLQGAQIILRPEPQRHLGEQRVAIIAAVPLEANSFAPCLSFIEWAREIDLKILVREHPRAPREDRARWRKISGLEFVESSGNFATCLGKHRPSFLVTWYSTAILDAIVNGVIPVTFMQDELDVVDTVFPVRETAVRWPAEKVRLQNLLDDKNARRTSADALYRCVCEPASQIVESER